jgi:hypothetical protein
VSNGECCCGETGEWTAARKLLESTKERLGSELSFEDVITGHGLGCALWARCPGDCVARSHVISLSIPYSRVKGPSALAAFTMQS